MCAVNYNNWDDLVFADQTNCVDEDDVVEVDIPKTPRPLIDVPTGPRYLQLPGGSVEEMKGNPKKFEIKFRDKAINFASMKSPEPKSDIFERSTVKVRVVMKIGGAAISDKSRPETLKPDVLRRIVSHIRIVKDKWDDDVGIILIHGAGSFGHNHARRYGLATGLSRENAILGFAKTRLSVTTLTNHVVDELVRENIPAIRVSPNVFLRTHDTKVSEVSFTRLNQHVQSVLNMGLVPVLHGDVMIDSVVGCSILSGDTIMAALTRAFSPQYCVFSTVTKGVYDRHPDIKGAKLIPEIKILDDGTYDTNISFTDSEERKENKFDVTGEMETKMKTAGSCASRGAQVFIVEGGSEAELEVLSGKRTSLPSTWIHAHATTS